MAINYANIGSIFEKKEMYDSAKVYYERSMEQNRMANSVLGISLCHNHFGQLAEIRGDLDGALREYRAAYDMMDKNVDRWHWMNACLSITKIYITKGDLKTALKYLTYAETSADEIQSKDYFSFVYEMKYSYFKKKGDFRSALDNYILSRTYADSTLNLKNVNHINNLRIQYETEKQNLKIVSLEHEKRSVIWLSIAGGFVLLLALTAFSFLWRWTVQKRRFAEQQQQLAEQQIKQLEQEKRLVATQAVLDGETRERARLARDLHDGLGSMLTGVKLNLLEMKQGAVMEYADVKRFDKALGLLDRSVQEMRRVAHHLMPDSLSRFGLKSAVNDFCNNLPSVHFTYYGDESRFDSKQEVMIYRTIYELVNNALKHAGAMHILVQIMQEPDRIAFTVQDDGCGFNPSTEFQGMGLQNIRTRVASYNGILNMDSQAGEGTEINVELKIEK